MGETFKNRWEENQKKLYSKEVVRSFIDVYLK